jgi:hypothetical protein
LCSVEPEKNQPLSYCIYVEHKEIKELFGRLSYTIDGYNNYTYKIKIDKKEYEVRSSDLKDRLLTILDATQSTATSTSNYPKTLLQAADKISKSNKKYRLTINDAKWEPGYLAMVILLNLHECQRNTV